MSAYMTAAEVAEAVEWSESTGEPGVSEGLLGKINQAAYEKIMSLPLPARIDELIASAVPLRHIIFQAKSRDRRGALLFQEEYRENVATVEAAMVRTGMEYRKEPNADLENPRYIKMIQSGAELLDGLCISLPQDVLVGYKA